MNRLRLEGTDIHAYGPGFTMERSRALHRSRGWCQFCGHRRATQAHHWALRYKPHSDLTADDLTGLCGRCHGLATKVRKQERERQGKLVTGATFD